MMDYHFRPLKSINISKNVENPDYVFDIKASFQDRNKLLVSASDNYLRILNSDFNIVSSYLAHRSPISSISYSQSSANQFYSSSNDKSFTIWDDRQPNFVGKIIASEEVLAAAVHSNDSLVALGMENEISFFDLRAVSSTPSKGKVLGKYSDVHSDVVTHLKFAPNHNNLLLSGGEDGLMAIYNIESQVSEDAVVSIMNTDCAINKFGFFGGNLEGIYSLSTIETSTFWHYPSAQRIASFQDIRERLQSDYLVDCLYYQPTNKVLILTGKYDGSSKFSIIDPSGVIQLTNELNAHQATVRCLCGLSDDVSNIVTGGEDGKVVLWQRSDTSIPAPAVSTSSFIPASQASQPTVGGIRSTKESKRQQHSGSNRNRLSEQGQNNGNTAGIRYRPY